MRLFDVLSNFIFTTSETICDYYLQTWYIRVAAVLLNQLNTTFSTVRISRMKGKPSCKMLELLTLISYPWTRRRWLTYYYSGTSLKRTSSKSDTFLRRTKNFVPRIPKESLITEPLQSGHSKAGTFFKSRMNIWTIIVLHKADT